MDPLAEQQRKVPVRVVVDVRGLGLTHQDDGLWRGQVDLMMVLADAAGNIVGHGGHSYAFRLKQEQYDDALKQGLAMDMAIDPANAATPVKARVAVRDVATGAVGTLDLPLK